MRFSNVKEMLENSVKLYGDKALYSLEGKDISYKEVYEKVLQAYPDYTLQIAVDMDFS